MLDFIESIDDPIFIKNRAGLYVNCNRSFEKFIGISRKQLIGSTAFEIADNRMAELYTGQDKELFESKTIQRYSAIVSTNHGLKHKVGFTKILFSTDEGDGFVGIVNKIFAPEPVPFAAPHKSLCSPRKNSLTNREVELLGLIATGGTAKEIGRNLLISHHTVTHHLKAIYTKLEVNNKIAALIKAKEHGYI